MNKATISIAAAAAVICLGLPTVVISAVFSVGGLGCLTTRTASATASTSATGAMQLGHQWDAEQVSIAETIIEVGIGKGVPQWGMVIALATAMQESGLRNLPHLGNKNDHDSIGVFQQRPSQGWGTPEQLASPEYQAERFFDKLLKVPHWQELPLTQAAQTVQHSAYPNAYEKWTQDALLMATYITSQGPWANPGGLGQCVSVAGWTHPLPGYEVTSGFRTAERPSHDGVDLPAPRGTPIRAAASGVVIRVVCDASLNRQPYSCDADGSPEVEGCGWFSEIRSGDFIHRYCHQLVKPDLVPGQSVVAGQVVGVVGTSGHSYGPHLHLEIHAGLVATSRNAISPIDHFQTMGVDLNGLTNYR